MISDPLKILAAIQIGCPICKADIDCLCDQFTSPHELPFHVHVERWEAVNARL